jgi:predicted phosphoribosyltransferase
VDKKTGTKTIHNGAGGPNQVVKRLKNKADEIEIIRNLSNFKAVEQFYNEFHAVLEEQIIEKVHLSS